MRELQALRKRYRVAQRPRRIVEQNGVHRALMPSDGRAHVPPRVDHRVGRLAHLPSSRPHCGECSRRSRLGGRSDELPLGALARGRPRQVLSPGRVL